ncbi:electron transport complex subunit RsxE [Papillibacter cinnamivorans]|uniref:Electron transport complex protein RnfE n=1 Tax=Papillibacter cinnamivorans DSM 12816 TaxID=1122930 RepID=A0A1W2BIK3_9FIRM|nr:electron transport complex subunit RsxE [Papillibacter cinnamivorans]SMC72703.1 electron transport complex protein RnfE [Papillibacter cinnamivorans DSM 12816]
MKPLGILKNGLITQNPVLMQLLGLCPALAVSTSLKNAVGMGIAVTAVLVLSNLLASLLQKPVPDKIRSLVHITVTAGLVTIADLLMRAYFPDLSASLGIYVPLIAVNCILFARAGAFASGTPPLASVLNGLFMGLGFTGILCAVSAVREILGNGTIWGVSLFGGGYPPALIMLMPAGGFLTLGFLMAAAQYAGRRNHP